MILHYIVAFLACVSFAPFFICALIPDYTFDKYYKKFFIDKENKEFIDRAAYRTADRIKNEIAFGKTDGIISYEDDGSKPKVRIIPVYLSNKREHKYFMKLLINKYNINKSLLRDVYEFS